MNRRPLLVANWKMHLGRAEEAIGLVRRLRPRLSAVAVDVVLCPPFTVLVPLAEILRPTAIGLGAQTMHWDVRGAATGEVAPAMLQGVCTHVILGHSERRRAGGEGESDSAVKRKVRAALAHDLTPIICVGEDGARRDGGETAAFVTGQVLAALDGLAAGDVQRCVVAYEPIWAIGTGRSASPADANRVIGVVVRGAVADRFGQSTADHLRVLYGGSVTADNIAAFMVMPEIDGALVGGASLTEGFVDLVMHAGKAVSRPG